MLLTYQLSGWVICETTKNVDRWQARCSTLRRRISRRRTTLTVNMSRQSRRRDTLRRRNLITRFTYSTHLTFTSPAVWPSDYQITLSLIFKSHWPWPSNRFDLLHLGHARNSACLRYVQKASQAASRSRLISLHGCILNYGYLVSLDVLFFYISQHFTIMVNTNNMETVKVGQKYFCTVAAY